MAPCQILAGCSKNDSEAQSNDVSGRSIRAKAPSSKDSAQFAPLLTVDFAVGGTVPEPSTWVMLLLDFAGLGYAGYRRAAAHGLISSIRRVEKHPATHENAILATLFLPLAHRASSNGTP